MHVYHLYISFFSCYVLDKDVTIEDLKTLKKVELDDLIKKYGQRRTFGRILVEWIIAHDLPIDSL